MPLENHMDKDCMKPVLAQDKLQVLAYFSVSQLHKIEYLHSILVPHREAIFKSIIHFLNQTGDRGM